jgi:hypothetical protein
MAAAIIIPAVITGGWCEQYFSIPYSGAHFNPYVVLGIATIDPANCLLGGAFAPAGFEMEGEEATP